MLRKETRAGFLEEDPFFFFAEIRKMRGIGNGNKVGRGEENTEKAMPCGHRLEVGPAGTTESY